ncbi:MAG: helix-turn-helix transcriptional regulator [Acetobacter sp.]|nr:helix-turn-helix transcriptional regulator [Bacteroides sp.]MCM1341479.1 helix-turn-helix transcriptional regulator [Acetobacter sp.]MCM1434172.1 helix-turn-helix transcriptional regulator [Clostridiales bacterium]
MERKVSKAKREMVAYALKSLREKANLKQEEVAMAIGRTRSSYGFYESAKVMPNIEILEKICRLYRVPMSTFNFDTDTIKATVPEYELEDDKKSDMKFEDLSELEKKIFLKLRTMRREDKVSLFNDLNKNVSDD